MNAGAFSDTVAACCVTHMVLQERHRQFEVARSDKSAMLVQLAPLQVATVSKNGVTRESCTVWQPLGKCRDGHVI